jgi:hypothetical protein
MTICWVCESRHARGSGRDPDRCEPCSGFHNPHFLIDATHAQALAKMRHADRLQVAGTNADLIVASHAQVMEDLKAIEAARCVVLPLETLSAVRHHVGSEPKRFATRGEAWVAIAQSGIPGLSVSMAHDGVRLG